MELGSKDGIKDDMALGSELGLVLGKSSPYSAQTFFLLRLHFAGREQSLKFSCAVQNLAPNPSQIVKASDLVTPRTHLSFVSLEVTQRFGQLGVLA